MIARRLVLAAALATPRLARSQPVRRRPVVCYLALGTEEADGPYIAALREGLRAQGLVESRNLTIELRYAHGEGDSARRIIQDMAALPADVFVAPGPTAARAIRRLTSIPVVAVGLPSVPADPELFASLARPGGSVTGFSTFGEELSSKRLDLILEMLPATRVIGILHNMSAITLDGWGSRTEAAAAARGLHALRLPVSSASGTEIASGLQRLKSQGATAIIVVRDFLTTTRRNDILAAAAQARLAVIAEQRLFAQEGALFTYGANLPDLFRRAAEYVARILRGERAGELPVQLPTAVELVLNLRTARMLDLAVPATILARADEVIE